MISLVNAILYLSIGIIFLILGYLVVKNGTTKENLSFAIGVFGFALYGLLHSFYYFEFVSGSLNLAILVIGTLIFVISPIGLMLCALVINKGAYTLTSLSTWTGTGLYTIYQAILVLSYYLLEEDPSLFNIDTIFLRSAYNLSVLLPMLVAIHQFYLLTTEISVPDLKQKIFLLLGGIVITSSGLVIFVVLLFIAEPLIPIGLIIGIVGELIIVYSFITKPETSQKEPATSS